MFANNVTTAPIMMSVMAIATSISISVKALRLRNRSLPNIARDMRKVLFTARGPFRESCSTLYYAPPKQKGREFSADHAAHQRRPPS
jgi:hypothetical protein